MSVLCLPVHQPTVVRREIKRPQRSRTSMDAKLQRVEDVLLASILDHHPNEHSALSRLLTDIDATPDASQPRRDSHSFTPRQMEQMEALLIAVAVDAHERRDSALHNLLEDIDQEARERAEFDMQIDNDPDGLG